MVQSFGGPPPQITPLTGYSFVLRNNGGALVESSEHVVYLDHNKDVHELYIVRPGSGGWIDRNLTVERGLTGF